ncbi:MAG: hypothetical protein HYW02_08695 [Deltaproteobacteria bacterium]|nr:hypothetical protein [Deltaproteobacteria bacterium]
MRIELPLSGQEAARLYWELSQRGARSVGEKIPWSYEEISDEEILILALRQCRYDPRLLEVMVDFFSQGKFRLNPISFKRALKEGGLLPVMAVIGEYVMESVVSTEVQEIVRYLMFGAKPVPTQLFFSTLYRIGGKKIEEVLERPPWAFKKWGFLAADPPLEKEFKKRIYLFDTTTRLNLLRRLTQEKKRFRLKDYLKVLGYSVSRQQALKDLNSILWVRKRGKGKGRVYLSPV